MWVITIFSILVVVFAGVAVRFSNPIIRKLTELKNGTKLTNEQSKRRKNMPLYIAVGYGIVVLIVAVVFISDNHGGKSAAQSKSTHTIAMAQMGDKAQVSTVQELSQLSSKIVSWGVSETEAEKLTINAFKKYYAATAPNAKSDGKNYDNWAEIHTSLLSADQYAKSNNFTLMQSSWQAIQQDLNIIQGKKVGQVETNFS